MAENVTVARPYAEAAYKLASAENCLQPWADALSGLAVIVDQPEMRECIGNPNLSVESVVQLLLDVAGKGVGADVQRFVRLLAENERLALLPEIAALFESLKNNHEGVREALVTSAFPLDDAALKALVADLEKKFNARIKARVAVDPELIGGVRIAVGDQVVDASVRSKLAAMTTALTI